MPWDDVDKERILQIVRQISGQGLDKSKNLIPPVKLKGTGFGFYWCPTKKSLVKVNRGIVIYIISYEMDEKDRILAYDGVQMIAVHPDEIEEVGFD